jgi:dCMP deaminase
MMEKKKSRPSKEEYYLRIAEQVSTRGTCMRAQGGVIIVKNDQIVATGYIGSPRKTKDCLERGNCLRTELKIPSGHRYELCRSVHAEMNAIINASRSGANILGGDLYLFTANIFAGERKLVNAHPCFICKKMIINAGLQRVITRMADGGLKIHSVGEWVKNWQKKDLVDDREKYDNKYDFSKCNKC